MRDCRLKDIVFNYSVVEDAEDDGAEAPDALKAGERRGYHCCYCTREPMPDYKALTDHVEAEHKQKGRGKKRMGGRGCSQSI